jgi:uncharacterized protein
MAPRQHKKNGDGAESSAENEGSTRKCIASGRSFPQEKLIRFVVGPDNFIVPDLEERLPGRGFWLSADPDMINTACAKQLLSKAARQKVEYSPTLAVDVEKLLTRRCLDRVSLARRAGQAVAGFEKASIWLRRNGHKGSVVLEASDGASGGKEKFRRLAGDATVVDLFSAAELGGAMGSERTVHLVIAPGGLADGIIRETSRLAGFRKSAATENDETDDAN